MSYIRPSFTIMWNKFVYIYGDGDLSSVGEKIGGKVDENIKIGKTHPLLGFTNACAIRMSYSLNYSGTTVTRGMWKTVSGADEKQYIYKVSDLRDFLTHTFGKPDKTIKNPKLRDFSSSQGILIFTVSGWSDATGHATLWNKSICSDHCYFFPQAQEASLWLLK